MISSLYGITPIYQGPPLPISTILEIEEELIDHLALPEKRNSPEELSRDCGLLYQFLASSASEKNKLEILYKFFHRLISKLTPAQQAEVYLKAAPFFAFINREGEIKFEIVWIYARVLHLAETHPQIEMSYEQIEGELDYFERELFHHTTIRSKLEISLEKKLEAVEANLHKIIQTGEQFHETMHLYLNEAKTWIQDEKMAEAKKLLRCLKNIILDEGIKSDKVFRDTRTNYSSLIDNESKNILNKPFYPMPQWSKFRRAFQKLLKEYKNSASYSQEFKKLLSEIISHCVQHLALMKPCEFEFLIVGSLTREDATPYSDFDVTILILDESKREEFGKRYLPTLIPLIRFYLGCLDDQWIINPVSKKGIYNIKRFGCDLDGADMDHLMEYKTFNVNFPLSSPTPPYLPLLTNTANNMIQWITRDSVYEENGDSKANSDYLFPIQYSLFFSQPLASSASHSQIYNNFKSLLNTWLETPQKRIFASLQFMSYNLKAFQNRHQHVVRPDQLTRESIVNIKKGWLHPLILWCYDLALYFGYKNISKIQDIISKLKEEQQLKQMRSFLDAVEASMSHLYALKEEKQKQIQRLPDRGDPNEVYIPNVNLNQFDISYRAHLPILTSEEFKLLKNIETNILEPAYAFSNGLIISSCGFESLKLVVFPHPFISLCWKYLAKLSSKNSISDLKQINEILHAKNLCASKSEYDLGLTSELIKILLQDYRQYRSKEKRVAWVLAFLKIEPLYVLFEGHEIQKILDLIFTEALDNGWRLGRDLELIKFCEEVKQLTTNEDATQDENFKLITIDLDNPFDTNNGCVYHLKPFFLQQLLAENGQFQKIIDEVPANHTAIPIIVNGKKLLWVKVCPENPAMENFSWHLSWSIGKASVPPSISGKLHVKGQSIAIHLSRHVDGIRLSSAREEFKNISSASFTRSLLQVLIASPGDDKPEDYILVSEGNKFSLKRIDNERIMAKSVDKSYIGYFNSAGIRSILFFLESMQLPLDEKTLQNFRDVSPQKLAASSLEFLESLHRQFKCIFSDEDVRNHFLPASLAKKWGAKASETSILTVFVTSTWFKRLFGNLQLLHLYCRTPGITGDDLLQSMHKSLFNLLQPAWKIALKGEMPASIERLDHANLFLKDAKTYHRTSFKPGLQLMSDAQGMKAVNQTDVLDCYHARKHHPIMLQEMREKMVKEVVVTTLKKLMDSDLSFVEDFCNLFALNQNQILDNIRGMNISKNQQILVLDALKKTKSKLNVLDLTHYKDAIDDNYLYYILERHGKRLIMINLSHCLQITPTGIGFIQKFCIYTSLKLILDGCTFTYFKISNYTNRLALKELSLNDCPNLTSVEIGPTLLQKISLRGSKNISILNFASPYLHSIDIRGCSSLSLDCLAANISAPFLLQKVESTFGWDEDSILERFPFLCPYLKKISDKILKNIIYQLKICSFSILKANPSTVKKLNTYLDYLAQPRPNFRLWIKNEKYAKFWPAIIAISAKDDAQNYIPFFYRFINDTNKNLEENAKECLIIIGDCKYILEEKVESRKIHLIKLITDRSNYCDSRQYPGCELTPGSILLKLLNDISDNVIKAAAAQIGAKYDSVSNEVFEKLTFNVLYRTNVDVIATALETLLKLASDVQFISLCDKLDDHKFLYLSKQRANIVSAIELIKFKRSRNNPIEIVRKYLESNVHSDIMLFISIKCIEYSFCDDNTTRITIFKILDRAFNKRLYFQDLSSELFVCAINALKYVIKDCPADYEKLRSLRHECFASEAIVAFINLIVYCQINTQENQLYILKNLEHDDLKVQQAVLNALVKCKRQNFSFYIDKLLELLKSNKVLIVCGAIEALGICGSLDTRIITTLLELFEGASIQVKLSILKAFEQLETGDLHIVKLLEKIVLEKDSAVELRQGAIKALGVISKKLILPSEILFTALTYEKNTYNLILICQILSKKECNRFGKFTLLYKLYGLYDLYKSEDSNLRKAAANAVGTILKNSDLLEHMKFFLEANGSINTNLQLAVIQACGATRTCTKEIVSYLDQQIRYNTDPLIVEAVLEALKKINVTDQKLLDFLFYKSLSENGNMYYVAFKHLALNLPIATLLNLEFSEVKQALFILREAEDVDSIAEIVGEQVRA